MEKRNTSLPNKKSILKVNRKSLEVHNREDKIDEQNQQEKVETSFSVADFSNNLNDLCLKTPNHKKICQDENKKSVKNKVTFNPPPGSFNITFDTSESESDNDDLDISAVIDNVKATPPKPLKGVTVFVDVRAENENRSKAISRELERLGAMIADKIGNHITHVVFKDGRKGTLTQLRKYSNIHFVSVLWVDACKTTGCKVNEMLYPARLPDEDIVGVPPARVKRVKSLQPKSFDEDVNNSAKKEERKRKRLKRLNKDFDTPTDQIICLDSQEYIKSSDLHKLVATPLAIPDTPWILNYINGSDNKSKEISPDAICSKLDLNSSQDEIKSLSQDVQCKLNFDTAKGTPNKHDSCFINIGSSPTNCNQDNTNNIGSRTDNSTLKASLKSSSSSSSTISKKPEQKTKDTPKSQRKQKFASSNQDKDAVENQVKALPTPKPTAKTNKKNDPSYDVSKGILPASTSSPLKRKTVEIMSNDLQNPNIQTENTILPQGIKKKKKLMSKNKFLFPQEKLISPALKNDRKEVKVMKKPENVLKKKIITVAPTNGRERPNPFTVLQQLEHSVKDDTLLNNTKNTTLIDKDVKKKQDDCSKEISKRYCLLIEDNLTKKPENKLDERKVEEKMKEPPSQKETNLKEKVVERRRSKRSYYARRSTIDFQVTQKFNKAKSKKEILAKTKKEEDSTVLKNVVTDSVQSSPLPKEFSLTNIEPIGLNVSFVHDENEGLVCTSQNGGTVIRIDDDDTEPSDNETAENKDISEVQHDADLDSGISDSEEINEEAETSQEEKISNDSPSKTSLPTISSNRNMSLQSTSINSTNRTINRSTSIKKCKQSLVCTSLHFSEQDFAKMAVKTLKEFQMKKNIAPDTTHIIAGSGRRTLNILHAITQGCWILKPQWLSDSLEANCWLNEEDYEMFEQFPAAKVSRLNREKYGKSNCVRLFSKLPRIFLAEVTSPPHEEMMKLVTSCGGQLTNSIRKAGIVLGLVTCRRNDIKILSEKWILDSITNGHLMPTKEYEYLTGSFQRDRSPDY